MSGIPDSDLTLYVSVHGACDGLMMTVLFGVVTLVAPPGSSHSVLWSVTNLAIGVGQIAGLPAAGRAKLYMVSSMHMHDRWRVCPLRQRA